MDRQRADRLAKRRALTAAREKKRLCRKAATEDREFNEIYDHVDRAFASSGGARDISVTPGFGPGQKGCGGSYRVLRDGRLVRK